MLDRLPSHRHPRHPARSWLLAGLVVALLWLQHAVWAHAAEHARERREGHAVGTAVCALCVAHASLDCLPDTVKSLPVVARGHVETPAVQWVSAPARPLRPYQSRAPPA